MTHTLVASATRQHIIGFDRPFTVIGERINPTGRKKLAAEMQAGNFETVIRMPWHRWLQAPIFSTSTRASPP
jgi:5-methyltetrahydrofolate--homocysteine methyltransferase